MFTLSQLLADHPRGLILDSCSTEIHACAWSPAGWGAAVIEREEASRGLPLAAGRALRAAGWVVGDLDAVVFCAGPGSVLGVRLAAATVRTWRAVKPGLGVYSYLGLPLVSLGTEARASGAGVLVDARQDSWHAVLPERPLEVARVPNSALDNGRRWVTPAGFKRWTQPPAGVVLEEVAYEPLRWLREAGDVELFSEAVEPEAFLSQVPSYVEWTPRVHQAPGATGSSKP